MGAFYNLSGVLIILMLAGCESGGEGEGEDAKERIFNLALTYPPIGVSLNDKNSPCYKGKRLNVKQLTPGIIVAAVFLD